MIVFFVLSDPAVGAGSPADAAVVGPGVRRYAGRALLATMACHGRDPQELRSSEIKDSWRGYDRDEVDDLLERAAVTIESLDAEAAGSCQPPVPAAPQAAPAAAAVAVASEVPLPSSRDDADMLQRTLLLAQRAADDAVAEAQARARQMLEESEAKAQSLVSDAEATARRIAEGERRRLEAEILELSARREQLRADADALERVRDRVPRAHPRRDRVRPREPQRRGRAAARRGPRCTTSTCPRRAAPVADRRPRRSSPSSMPRPTKRCTRCESDQSAWDPGPDTRALGAVDAPSDVGAGVRGRGIRVPVARRRAAATDVGGERAAGRRVAATGARAGGRRPPRRRPTRRGCRPSDDWAPGAPGLGCPRALGARHRGARAVRVRRADGGQRRRHRLARRRRVLRVAARSGARRRAARAARRRAGLVLRQASPSRTVGGSAGAADASALHPLQIAPTPASPSTSTRGHAVA